ncbi:MAG TPA: lipopolysaccharide heptosyltransferase II, partial [Pyrinomonadaceae bacterium]
RPWAEGIFEGADFIDELLPLSGKSKGATALLSQARELRRRRFDLALLLPNAFAPALATFAARVPLRVGYATDGRRTLLTHPLAAPSWRGERHEVYYYLNLVAELERLLHGRKTAVVSEPRGEPQPRGELAVSDERRRAARALLRETGAREELPLVAICPGSTNSRAKRWPAERFAAVADMLCVRDGAQVVLIGAAEERDVSEEVARHMTQRPLILTGRTSLAETAALLAVADLLVTNDTGPAHLAAAVGCPVVVIFGPTNPLTTRPFSESAEIVRHPPDCAPCMLRDCPIDHRCMTAITPEEVYGRASVIVARARRFEVAR